ncbi:FAD-dependent oxidoreductase [uncultured Propionibacterium sp.]|uniref:FAD-dependent oxidoreductase n=1 Tax=uncultured Propionibacterium sp. TaxID=218066 RepID=UPI00292E83BD|nr:FAD-dependent oxidoreductase [uncultured Propionibacterium sp.]
MADRIVLAAPSRMGKGMLVSPTIFGNITVGPTAEDMEDRTDTAIKRGGFGFLQEKCHRIVPELRREEISDAYAGLRAAHDLADYLLEADESQRYVITAGIRSTGLTSALAVASTCWACGAAPAR